MPTVLLVLMLAVIGAVAGDAVTTAGPPASGPVPAAAGHRTDSATGSATASAADSATARPLAGRIVVIDPGHQLGNSRHRAQIDRQVAIGAGRRRACNTTGTATNAGFPEATFTWRVAVRMRQRLTALGARVLLTRTANSWARWGPCVDARGRRGNAVGADVKVSIHGDGSLARGAHGFHVIYAPDRRLTADTYRRSRALALAQRAALQRRGFVRATYIAGGDGLDVRSDLGTLNLSNMATVMVECGNMRNAGDARRMTSAAGQRRYAAALVDGVEAFLSAR